MVAWGANGDTPGKFERIVDSLNSPSKETIAVYGSLLAGMGGQEELGIGEQLRFVGPCEIRGSLFDLGEYPGLLLGSGVVHAELYEIADAAIFERLDAFELYDPSDPAGSLYLRKRARLTQPDRDAWLYEYNGDVSGIPSIPSGDWKSHCRERRSAATNAT